MGRKSLQALILRAPLCGANKHIVELFKEDYKSGNMTDIKSGSIAQQILGNIAKLSIWRYGKTIIRKNGRKQIWKYAAMKFNSKLEILLKYRYESMDKN